MGECIVGGISSTEIIAGTYMGDGAATRTINLSFTPKWVLLVEGRGRTSEGTSIYGGLCLPDMPVFDRSDASNKRAMQITTDGFAVGYLASGYGVSVFTNSSNSMYGYLAGK